LEIPAGALRETTTITITKDATPIGNIPEGYAKRSPVYKFEPDGLQFLKPAKFNINYEQADMQESQFEERTVAFYYINDNSTLEKTNPVSRDLVANKLSYEVTHFSFGIALSIRVLLVTVGIVSNPNAVLNVSNAVIAELLNPPTGMTSAEYYQANSAILGPFTTTVISILGYAFLRGNSRSHWNFRWDCKCVCSYSNF
jgi:hypothetical protein